MKKGVRYGGEDKQTFLDALEKTMGMVVQAQDMTGIRRENHYRWIKEDPEYAAKVETIMDRNLDLSESVLLKAVKNGELTAVFYHLNNKGKSRGYNVKEPDDNTEKKIVININSPLTNGDDDAS